MKQRKGDAQSRPESFKRVAQVMANYREENKRLKAVNADLLETQTMGATKNTPSFLYWLADRLVTVYGESPNTDFVLSLRERAKAGFKAIEKATS